MSEDTIAFKIKYTFVVDHPDFTACDYCGGMVEMRNSTKRVCIDYNHATEVATESYCYWHIECWEAAARGEGE